MFCTLFWCVHSGEEMIWKFKNLSLFGSWRNVRIGYSMFMQFASINLISALLLLQLNQIWEFWWVKSICLHLNKSDFHISSFVSDLKGCLEVCNCCLNLLKLFDCLPMWDYIYLKVCMLVWEVFVWTGRMNKRFRTILMVIKEYKADLFVECLYAYMRI